MPLYQSNNASPFVQRIIDDSPFSDRFRALWHTILQFTGLQVCQEIWPLRRNIYKILR